MTNKELRLKCLLEAADLLRDIEVLDEGAVKTAKKYKLDKYLSRHGYKGDKNEGTINVDGEEYKIDRRKSRTMEVDGGPLGKQDAVRQTSADVLSNDPKIHLDRNFEKLKNNKRRDALLQHEIGHIKNHNLSGSYSNTKEGRDAILDSMSKTQSAMISGNATEYKDEVKRNLKEAIPDKSKESTTKKELIRKDNLEKLKKYENDVQHADRSEYEADAYASQHKNGDHLKRGVREYYKHVNSTKGIDNQIKDTEKAIGMQLELSKNEKDDIRKRQNTIAQNDMKQRNRAAKDKTVDKSIYK